MVVTDALFNQGHTLLKFFLQVDSKEGLIESTYSRFLVFFSLRQETWKAKLTVLHATGP